MKKKVVLAFSGGLDTSFCVKYLKDDLHYDVFSVTVNTGGFSTQELNDIEQRAYSLGVIKHTTIDAVKNYYDKVIKYLIYGNVLKNNTYPLSVSAERMNQAIATIEYAQSIQADAVAHGSTGAGNDQVRFDMVFQIIAPQMKVITPIRELKLSRDQEIQYLKDKGVTNINFEKAAYSINKGLWGTSVGGKETLTSHLPLPENAFPSDVIHKDEKNITLIFQKGELMQVNDKIAHPAELIQYLSTLVDGYGIGRDIHVGDTIIGIKGRVGFEAAAPMIIIKAHHLLEKHTLTKWQLYWKDQIANFYGTWLHEGQFLDPVMRNMENMLQDMQQNVTGKVFITIAPYRFVLNGIASPYDLMSAKFGQYGEMNNAWTGDDVKGFSKIFSNQTFIYHSIHKE